MLLRDQNLVGLNVAEPMVHWKDAAEVARLEEDHPESHPGNRLIALSES